MQCNDVLHMCGVCMYCLMHSFPGFCRLRMHSKGGSPVAFMEYQDVRFAAQVMQALQGTFLLSSDRGAIRIEYAKSKMAAEVGLLTQHLKHDYMGDFCPRSKKRNRNCMLYCWEKKSFFTITVLRCKYLLGFENFVFDSVGTDATLIV